VRKEEGAPIRGTTSLAATRRGGLGREQERELRAIRKNRPGLFFGIMVVVYQLPRISIHFPPVKTVDRQWRTNCILLNKHRAFYIPRFFIKTATIEMCGDGSHLGKDVHLTLLQNSNCLKISSKKHCIHRIKHYKARTKLGACLLFFGQCSW
jgi:hypothetical protein